MKSVVIFGAGGFGRQVLEIFRSFQQRPRQARAVDVAGDFAGEKENVAGGALGFLHLGGLDTRA